jgi:hypothetical protein
MSLLLSYTFETVAGRIVLASAAVAATIYLWAKVIWHPRSWIRRVPTYLVVRIIIAPNARKATTFLIHFFELHITPQLDAKIETVREDVNDVRVDLRDLSGRNDDQHEVNSLKIAELEVAIKDTNSKLVDTNTRLAKVTEHLAIQLTTPGLPTPPGGIPITVKLDDIS